MKFASRVSAVTHISSTTRNMAFTEILAHAVGTNMGRISSKLEVPEFESNMSKT